MQIAINTASTLDAPAGASGSALETAWGAWRQLAEVVRNYEPSVVVLTPRKPVRMREALGLDFGVGALTLSEVAVPFSHPWLRGARVAVVDDVVNVGSSIARAVRAVEAAGAAEIRAFAITSRDSTKLVGDLDIEYACDAVLGRLELREFGRRVPEVLQRLAKPYDLDFPLLRCAPRRPLHSFEELYAALRSLHGSDRIYDLSTPTGHLGGVRRMALDFGDDAGTNWKVRIYVHEPTGRCNLMPIRVSPALPIDADGQWTPLAAAIWAAVWRDVAADPGGSQDRAFGSVLAPGREAAARLRMFCDAIDFGQRFIDAHAHVLTLDLDAPLEMDDAAMILGPRVRNVPVCEMVREPAGERGVITAKRPGTSPFLTAAKDNGFIEDVRGRAALKPEPVFIAIFETLADWIGAEDVELYRFDWPHTRDEIRRDAHLRLQIGPTVADITALIAELCDLPRPHARAHATRLLDRYIDAGGVVPTMTEYDGEVYRVYRRGEGSLRNASAQRRLYAWRASNRPLSLTRASKLFAILDYTTKEEDKVIGVLAQQRGNVLAYRPSLLDDGGDAAQYWADTDQVHEVS